MTAQKYTSQKGFTLIELLVVIGILAVLLAITLIAINPARQFANANNTQRRSEVSQVLNAVGQYVAENQGQLPAEINALASGSATALNSTNFPNLCGELVPAYLPAFPRDPSLTGSPEVTQANCGGAWTTGYEVTRDANNRITVTAPSTNIPPATEVITVTR